MVGSMQTPIIPIGSGQTQELIAPVQDTLIAKQNYAVGQQFILGGALFTVTKSGGISVGDTINMNTDVEASDNITDQIKEIQKWNDVSSKFTISSGVTCTLMYAFEKDGLVIFSLAITVDTSVGNQMIPLYVDNSIKPKNSTALSVANGAAGSAINDLTAFLIVDGRLVIRTVTGVSGKSIFVSGCYLIDSI